jgi:hypothetical protein
MWYSNPMLQKKLGQRIAAFRKTRELTQVGYFNLPYDSEPPPAPAS